MESGINHTEIEDFAYLFSKGNERGLKYIFNQFYPSLCYFSFQITRDRFTSEEIASDAIMKTWNFHDKLDSIGAIKAYLYRVVYRDSLKIRRLFNTKGIVSFSESNEAADLENPYNLIVKSETLRLIKTAISELSPSNRKVVELYFLEGKTTGEIARQLMLHPSTIKTQKSRAIEALKKLIKLPVPYSLFIFLQIFFK